MIKFSVIVPAYNAEKYLPQTLDCLASQTLDGVEIIVVNDGSEDGTQAIARLFSLKYPNFVLINQRNSGVSHARNTGLEAARGRYVLFLDADDLLSPTALEHFYLRCEEAEADVGICRLKSFGSEGERFNPHADSLAKSGAIDPFDKRLLWNFLVGNKCYRRERLIDSGIRFPSLTYTEEGCFFMQYVYTAPKIVGVYEAAMLYRRHSAVEGYSVSQSVRRDLLSNFNAALDCIYIAACRAVGSLPRDTAEDYLQEIIYKAAYILIAQFYRPMWRSAESLLPQVKRRYDFLCSLMTYRTKEKTDALHRDIGALRFERTEIAEKPLVSAVADSDSAALINSVFLQNMPFFELLVPEGTQVPESWRGRENLRFVQREDFKNHAKRLAKGAHTVYIKSSIDNRLFSTALLLQGSKRLSFLPFRAAYAAARAVLTVTLNSKGKDRIF